MNSFISRFSPWLLALAAIAAIELTYYAAARPPRIAWNSFLNLKFTDADTFQRLVTHHKIVAFEHTGADIIQVGDSSGLHSVQPPVVMSHIPGWSYLNLSVATNLGYSGYYNLARLQLERNPHARYLVLYTSFMDGVPRRTLWDDDQDLMAPLIHREFLSPFYRLAQLPTLAARQRVTDFIYYQGYRYKARGAPLSTNRGYLAFQSIFRDSNGWTRETDVEGDVHTNIYRAILPGIIVGEAEPDVVRRALRGRAKVTDERFMDWWTFSKKSYFDHVYGAFAALARDYGVTPVLIFNPLPESTARPEFDEVMDWKAIEDGLRRVRERYPEVIVTGFDFWPDEKFSVRAHIGAPHSAESSHRVGRIMKDIIGDRQPVARARADLAERPGAPVTIDFSNPHPGYGWTDEAGATNGFPLAYVGPRNKAWMWAIASPSGAQSVRAVFQSGDERVPGRIALKVNGEPMHKLASGRDGADFQAEWAVPAAVVSRYGGWLQLEFDLGIEPDASAAGKRTVAFRRISIDSARASHEK